MMCYRDMTFCRSENCRNECGRQLTDEVRAGAARWWASPDNPKGEGAPICVGEFCDENGEVKSGD